MKFTARLPGDEWDPLQEPIVAFDHVRAAEDYAAQAYDDSAGEILPETGNEIDVEVRGSDGVVHTVVVAIEFEPTFYGRKRE